MMMVEQRAAAQASAKRERRRAGMSAANVGASSRYVLTEKVTGLMCQYQYTCTRLEVSSS